ncbi:hypothetical protein RRG08_010376 [Elysia crispata]|uniref:Uncharacterized protein n=1 Tax=Elysia crispata TaxID=231223 RepID=A0AAE1EDE6_9GAST|nr:hypothetical protein RRG08_010376 [Elysia crispata]
MSSLQEQYTSSLWLMEERLESQGAVDWDKGMWDQCFLSGSSGQSKVKTREMVWLKYGEHLVQTGWDGKMLTEQLWTTLRRFAAESRGDLL